MLKLIPGTSLSQAIHTLERSIQELANARSAADAASLLIQYQGWAAQESRMLSGIVTPDEIDRLVTPQAFWDLSSFTTVYKATQRQFIETRMDITTALLTDELRTMRTLQEEWDSSAAAVLDTNVLLEHSDHLDTLDWHEITGTRPPAKIILAIPMAVVDELDNLKISNKKYNDGREIRTLAANALRMLSQKLSGGSTSIILGRIGEPVTSELRLALVRQELGPVPLPVADSEIIARAQTLAPFARTVTVVTYDQGMIFRADTAQLRSHRLQYPPREKKAAYITRRS